MPEAAKENTPEGAEAFIRYYFDVVNELYENPTSDVPVEEIVDPECISCKTMVKEVRGLNKEGQRALGPLYIITDIKPIGGGPPGVQAFNMTIDVGPVEIETLASGEKTTVEGKTASGVGAAIWDGEKWRTYGMDLK